MGKEISGFLFQKTSPDAAVLSSSFNYGSCYLKMNAIINTLLKNSALYLYPPFVRAGQSFFARINYILIGTPSIMILKSVSFHKYP